MYQIAIHIHARPNNVQPGEPIESDGGTIATLDVPSTGRGTPFDVTFEAVGERLSALPRLFFEPDGSFVWVSPRGSDDWQVDGVLYDRAGRVLFVELKGRCPEQRFDELLGALGWPTTPVMIQLTRQAVFIEESEFRRVAVE